MSGTATFTFIRHAESTDNVKSVWAGWSDAPLSNHGMCGPSELTKPAIPTRFRHESAIFQQARALVTSLSMTTFNAILASPLKRAHMTALELEKCQTTSQPLLISPLLKERHFGVAEGKPSFWKRDLNRSLDDHVSDGIYPSLNGRNERFPEGESLDDVRNRAIQAWENMLLNYVHEACENHTHLHIAVVSHGLFIREALQALTRYDNALDLTTINGQWLRNTGWARVVLQVKGNVDQQEWAKHLQVELTHFNECAHLNTMKRQRGIGSTAYDSRQKDIRNFFTNRKPNEQ
ncbi:hypothetical protein MIND_00845100 [Mycena indigotica]|uniref:Phosphoglycerate mutase-like protein n=1 Tax=Mycena indigotica TaxID=2126181 RepID=A0A8H6SGI0_9AGAR|nr:uncharacterized protein MIND_00845100 [Mycena indigotica]KAF7298969.1 hypothetical protein MIND_00845100 [Mycena indigotica]